MSNKFSPYTGLGERDITTYDINTLMEALDRVHPLARVVWDRDCIQWEQQALPYYNREDTDPALRHVEVYSESYDWSQGYILAIYGLVNPDKKAGGIYYLVADPVLHYDYK